MTQAKHHINYDERKYIGRSLSNHLSKKEIASHLGISTVALNNEINNGMKKMKTSDGGIIYKYYPDSAQKFANSKKSMHSTSKTPDKVLKKISSYISDGEDSKIIFYNIREEFGIEAPSQATVYRLIRNIKNSQNDEEKRVQGVKLCKKGDQAFVDGEFKEAFQAYKRGADCGNSASLTSLGKLYFSGESGVQDFRKGFECFDKAADLKDAEAMWRKAWCYENGLGVEQNIDVCIDWYALSAFSGNQVGMTMTAFYLLHGTAANQDTKSAIKWFKKAAKLGNLYAQKWLFLHEKEAMDKLHEQVNFTYDEFFQFLRSAKNEFSPVQMDNDEFNKTMDEFTKVGLISEVLD